MSETTPHDDAWVELIFRVRVPWSQFLPETPDKEYVAMSIDSGVDLAVDNPDHLEFVQATLHGRAIDPTYNAAEMEEYYKTRSSR